LSYDQVEVVKDDPLGGHTVGPIRIGGVSFSPDAVYSILYRLRTIVARRTIAGTLHEFGNTVRITVNFTNRRQAQFVVLVEEIGVPDELLAAIDDTAFAVARLRLESQSETSSWEAYRNFLEAYALHLRFVRTGRPSDRDKAIAKYQVAIARSPGYALAHYNLGTLLYIRYEAAANRDAILQFREAAASDDDKIEALALAGLALAYCQQGHRFGEDAIKVAPLADDASTRAVAIADDLEETCFARGFSLQMMRRIDDAINWYEKVVSLRGETTGERRLKSFASTNQGFLHLTEKEDLAAAESSLIRARDLFPFNQMAYANLGEVHRRRKEYDLAVKAYEHALSISPTYVNGLNELGMIHISMARDKTEPDRREEDLVAAREWHDRALSLVPQYERRQLADLHKRYADAYAECGFAEDAEREYAEAATLGPVEEASPDRPRA
jgi:tetratricopeptide (TPR) repeat protein